MATMKLNSEVVILSLFPGFLCTLITLNAKEPMTASNAETL
jgi:hypothetical protein